MTSSQANPFRALPQMQALLEHSGAQALTEEFGRDSVSGALRGILDGLRAQIANDPETAVPDLEALVEKAAEQIRQKRNPRLRRVINATGIVLHTNLGRAPLAPEAIAAMAEVARGYCNLEFDLQSGRRRSRTHGISELVQELTGAQAGLAVNNGAAAILLAVSALAKGGEVVVSRGELVEIGGGFRVPEVIRQGGARLVEVGSTNKTRIADYAAAIGGDTRILLKVHQSNFRMVGFTAEAEIAELAALAAKHGLVLIADLGSGLLAKHPGSTEPTIVDALSAGADIVTCSGDKLLGGPQAGLIVGGEAPIAEVERHPLLRALRLDKMSLAALEATLRLHQDSPDRIPVRRMVEQSEEQLRSRAERLRALIGVGEIVRSEAFSGGGSLPEQSIASHALALDPPDGAEAAAVRLRTGDPAVVGRINKGHLLLDMLTVADDELDLLAVAVRAAIA